MSQEMSQLKLVFWNLLPPQFPASNLLLHVCSADMLTHASLTLPRGSPGLPRAEGPSLCLTPCLNEH